MLYYGLELEYFVKLKDEYTVIPAYRANVSTDGNIFLGELRTKIHENIVSAIFDLKKLIYITEKELEKQNQELKLYSEVTIPDQFLREIREHAAQYKEPLIERSIYGGKLGKILPRNKAKASLQVNISDNGWMCKEQGNVKLELNTSEVFDYVSIIRALDEEFKEDIKTAKRTKGVYAIKGGERGRRVEYRSLPATIEPERLIKVLSKQY